MATITDPAREIWISVRGWQKAFNRNGDQHLADLFTVSLS